MTLSLLSLVLKILSFALEAGEECTGHGNPTVGCYSRDKLEIEELLDGRLCTSLHSAFGFFSLLDECHLNIGID